MYPSSNLFVPGETIRKTVPFNIAILKHIHPRINPSPLKESGCRAQAQEPEVRADII
jgi:hypothetical protein